MILSVVRSATLHRESQPDVAWDKNWRSSLTRPNGLSGMAFLPT